MADSRPPVCLASRKKEIDPFVQERLASDPAPDGWQEALGFSLSVLSELPRAKISVAPKSVRVVAVADSDDERARLEDRLQRAKPEGVTLILEVSAPRAVIAPFAFDFSLQDGVGRMDACSAATPDAAAAILAGAKAAGLAGDADCPVGLGSPSSAWPVAVSHGLEALRELGGGRFTLSDMEAELTPPEGAPADKVAAAAAKLDAALPTSSGSPPRCPRWPPWRASRPRHRSSRRRFPPRAPCAWPGW